MTRKSQVQIDQERRDFILSKKPLLPNGECHYCGWSVPKLAHWCSTGCAREFESEKEALTLRHGL